MQLVINLGTGFQLIPKNEIEVIIDKLAFKSDLYQRER